MEIKIMILLKTFESENRKSIRKNKKIKDFLDSKLGCTLETICRNFFWKRKKYYFSKNKNIIYYKNSNSHLESVISIVERLIILIINLEIIKQE